MAYGAYQQGKGYPKDFGWMKDFSSESTHVSNIIDSSSHGRQLRRPVVEWPAVRILKDGREIREHKVDEWKWAFSKPSLRICIAERETYRNDRIIP